MAAPDWNGDWHHLPVRLSQTETSNLTGWIKARFSPHPSALFRPQTRLQRRLEAPLEAGFNGPERTGTRSDGRKRGRSALTGAVRAGLQFSVASPAVQYQQVAGVADVRRVEAVVVEVVEEAGGDEAVSFALGLQRLRRPLQLVQVRQGGCSGRRTVSGVVLNLG